jgi:cysteine desulfurase / selenocysteine lyase
MTLPNLLTKQGLAEEYRCYFPITERYVYLNHASVSPLSSSARDSMTELLEGVVHHGARKAEEWDRMQSAARGAAARLVNAEARQIAFLRNTSEALSIVANGLDWKPGDNIVSTAVEFPANVYPWARVAAEKEIELRLEPEMDGRIDVEHMLTLIDERTRVVTVSWVQYASGQKLDIRRIGQFCREREILFVVDAVQGLGAFELDVQRDCVAVFASSAHKFLLGPKGISLLYLSDWALERVHPTVIGWTAVENYRDYLTHDLSLRDGAVRFEGGTLNEFGICGLGAAIELLLRAGPQKVEQHLLALTDHLVERLNERGYRVASPRRAGDSSAIIVCCHPEFSADKVCGELDARNIITSARLGRLRIAPHFYNTLADADALIDALPA